jgi:hydrogenase small subunit
MAFATVTKDLVAQLDVLCITAGLGRDGAPLHGAPIAMTAASQPSIEDLLLGQVPWIPKGNLDHPSLALANGDDLLRLFHQTAQVCIAVLDEYVSPTA